MPCILSLSLLSLIEHMNRLVLNPQCLVPELRCQANIGSIGQCNLPISVIGGGDLCYAMV